MHFETIWNESESIAKSYTSLSRKEIMRACRTALDDLADAEDSAEYHLALGQMLFGLCSLCAHVEEKKDIPLNSATALIQENQRKRQHLLDGDENI